MVALRPPVTQGLPFLWTSIFVKFELLPATGQVFIYTTRTDG
jgi:hypothetical protein